MNRPAVVVALVVSVAVAVAVPIYAMSLDEWGDTGAMLFPLIFILAVASAIASGVRLAKLTADLHARTERPR